MTALLLKGVVWRFSRQIAALEVEADNNRRVNSEAVHPTFPTSPGVDVPISSHADKISSEYQLNRPLPPVLFSPLPEPPHYRKFACHALLRQ